VLTTDFLHANGSRSGALVGHDVAMIEPSRAAVPESEAEALAGAMTASHPPKVSKREAQVLAALGSRLSNAEIAAGLHISVRTVESHVSSLLRKHGVSDRLALAALAVRPGPGRPQVLGVPSAWTSFVGRGAERDATLAALESSRLVTLVGSGGVGKTRLAAVVAEAAAVSFPAGGAFVDLVPVRDGFVAQAVAAALGVAERAQVPLADVIAERLRQHRSLLILDNCEHLLDAVAGFAERILAIAAGVRVLATSRERLGIPGERVMPVAPLPLNSDAETLYIDRTKASDPSFRADATLVADICAKLDGVPLAIELAAARTPSLGAAGLLVALEDRLRVLAGGRGTDARHRSMRAVIDWSHDLLDDQERALLRRLAVFVGSFDLAAAVAVAPGRDPAFVADLLGRLTDKHLVVHQRPAPGWWRLPTMIRAYAGDQLRTSGEQAEVQERHLRWAARTAARLEARQHDRWQDIFDLVADDLRSALAAAPPGPGDLPHRLARALGRLAYARRFLTEAVTDHRQAAEHARFPTDAAEDLRVAADCALALGDFTEAHVLLLASAEQARVAGVGNAQAIALASAVIAGHRHPGDRNHIPHQRLRELLAEASTAGDLHDVVVAAHLAAARAWTASGARFSPDPALSAAAADAARATGDPVLISAALDAVGLAVVGAGRLRDALSIVTERLALLIPHAVDDPRFAVEISDAYGIVVMYAMLVGDLPTAVATARQYLADDLAHHKALATLVAPLVLMGGLDEALRLAGAAWENWHGAGRRYTLLKAETLMATALAYGLRGDGEQFRLWRNRAAQAANVTDITQSSNHASFAAFVDARVALHTGRVSAATATTRQQFTGFVANRYEPYVRAVEAELAVVAGLPDAAERLSQAASAAEQNDWAAASLTRARGRLYHDQAALTASVKGWELIGARFERACTLLLIPDRAHEGRTELAAIGVPQPAYLNRTPDAQIPAGPAQE
jgi:predicted ATPase/DNA-binding CsgD family transcriptional regulator